MKTTSKQNELMNCSCGLAPTNARCMLCKYYVTCVYMSVKIFC